MKTMNFSSNKSVRYNRLAAAGDDSTSDIETSLQEAVLESRWKRRFLALLTLFCLSFILEALLCLYVAFNISKARLCYVRDGVEEPYSPAKNIISYEQRWLTGDPDTPKFVGEPQPELDEAWHNLLKETLIRVSQEELSRANSTSIPLEDRGFAAGLGVSHDLHCLKRINQFFHREYYYSSQPQDWDELAAHVQHCLESLRQTVLCRADTTLYTLEWTTHSKVKPTVRSHHPHICGNFDNLHEWMIGRAANMSRLVKPSDDFYDGHEYDPISGVVVDHKSHHDKLGNTK